MSGILDILAQLRSAASAVGSAIWAIDVRDNIASALRKSADAIEECYRNVNSASLREDAFAAALQDAIDDELLPIPATVIDDNSLPGTKIQDGTIPLRKLSEAVQITVDSALSGTSTNPVQNKVIKETIDELNGSLATKQEAMPDISRTTVESSVIDIAKEGTTGNLNVSTGEIGTGNGLVSDYIDISHTVRFYRATGSSSKFGSDSYCLYNADHEFIAGFAGNTSYTFQDYDGYTYCVPIDVSNTPGAVYARIQFGGVAAWSYHMVNEYSRYDIDVEEVVSARTDINAVEHSTLKDSLNSSFGILSNEIEQIESTENIGQDYVIYPYDNVRKVKVESDQTTTMTIRGITVADFDHMGTPTVGNESIEVVSNYDGPGMKFRVIALSPRTDSGAGAFYVLNGMASGLEVGKKYRIHIKTSDPTIDTSGGGKYIRIYCKAGCNTWSGQEQQTNPEHAYVSTIFTATATTQAILINPFMTNRADVYLPAIGDETIIEDFYINEVSDDVALYTHEAVFSQTVTGKKLTYVVNGDKFVVSGGDNISISKAISGLMSVNGILPSNAGNVEYKSHLQGRKLITLGDSITQAKTTYTNYVDYPSMIADITGMDVFNAGLGTTRMSFTQNGDNIDIISFANLCDMINSGDWTELQALANTPSQSNRETIAMVYNYFSTLDWSEVDYISVAFGANDATSALMDNENNKYDKYTYIGAFRYGIEKIMSKYPNIRIIALTPIYRHFGSADGDQDSDNTRMTTGGYYYYELAEKLIECCKEYHLPYIDLYNLCGINKINWKTYVREADGLHASYDGQCVMARVAASGMISVL